MVGKSALHLCYMNGATVDQQNQPTIGVDSHTHEILTSFGGKVSAVLDIFKLHSINSLPFHLTKILKVTYIVSNLIKS